MKAIFSHVLHQFAPNDVDMVWNELLEDELRNQQKAKAGYRTVKKHFSRQFSSEMFYLFCQRLPNGHVLFERCLFESWTLVD